LEKNLIYYYSHLLGKFKKYIGRSFGEEK